MCVLEKSRKTRSRSRSGQLGNISVTLKLEKDEEIEI